MKSEWPLVSIVDLQASQKWALNGGPFGSKLVTRDYVSFGVPVIRGINLPIKSRFHMDDFVYVSEEKADELLPNNAHPGDVIFTQRGTLGQVGIIPFTSPFKRFVISQSQMKITVDITKTNPFWLYYTFRTPSTQQALINRASSSGVPHINLETLRQFRIALPPYPIQGKIAAVLSTYDNLIENNLRRIKILEEMSQTLYREWFVKFRFPGHQKVKMVNSPLGKIPEGWEVLNVQNIVKRHPPGKLYEQKTVCADGTVPVLDQGRSGVIGYHEDSPGVEANEENPVIIFANHTCYQRIIHFPFSAIQNVIPFYPNPDHYRNIYWLHYATKDLISFNDYKGHWPEYMGKKVVVPTIQVSEDFGSDIKPNILLVFKLQEKCKNLSQTRDLLLPKLISGELDVSELDIAIPEANT